MKQIILLITLTYSLQLNAQLTKNTWLVGGDFNYNNYSSKISSSIKSKNSRLNSNINSGIFLSDKLAMGLNINYFAFFEKIHQTDGTVTKINQNDFSIGPFIRYYLLDKEKIFNVFINSRYNFLKNKENEFEQSVGAVYFLNTSIGVEFSGGYSIIKSNFTGQSLNRLLLKIGFQMHLVKE